MFRAQRMPDDIVLPVDDDLVFWNTLKIIAESIMAGCFLICLYLCLFGKWLKVQ